MKNHSQKIGRQSDRSVDEPTGTSVGLLRKRLAAAHKTVHSINKKIDAIFEMLLELDEKVTKINNRFSKLAKELGYKA